MNARIKISISSTWVMDRFKDDVFPTFFLKQEIIDKFGDSFSVVDSSLTDIILDPKMDLKELGDRLEDIKKIFSAHYDLDLNNDILSISIVFPDEDKKDNNKNYSLFDDDFDDDNENRAEYKCTLQESLDKINDLVGCNEFKSLIKELNDIAPQIIKNKTFESFLYQTYIFSINDGYGLSTCLSLFASFLSSLNMGQTFDTSISEFKLGAPKGESTDPFSDINYFFTHSFTDDIQVICIDICEWLNHLHTKVFKNFLSDIEKRMSKFIIIFRVPFVDKEVLDKIKYHINDLMFVRTVVFPPFTEAEIQKCALAELKKYGFSVSNNAWKGFHERIAEEKSDGKFYGLNTVKKVIRELLYKKQLNNVKLGKDDLTITKKDVLAICGNSSDTGLSGYEMLQRLVGGENFKKQIDQIISQIEFVKSNPDIQSPCIHMRFVGNPGTGKTTVARILGKILKEKRVLRVGGFYEYAGRDFCGRYVGETAPKTSSMCRDAYGSVLFIDEAYSLYRGDDNGRDFGREALDTLIAEMENHRSDLLVIMAGYTDDMETLMKGNAGLASRMPYLIYFPNFTREQLYDIFVSMVKRQFKYEDDLFDAARDYFNNLSDEILNSKEFSNARFVRNLFERTWSKASMRCHLLGVKAVVLTKDDFERSIGDKEFKVIMQKKNKLGFGN